MATQVILLEKIEKLGDMGETVTVRPGFARNYLIPQNKALRATEANRSYFESQKAALEKRNLEKKKEAENHASSLNNLTVTLIRQAGENGQLYGSVSARDIAEAINDNVERKIERNMVEVNQNFKEIGLFDVIVALHPEVKKQVTINIARTEDEADIQKKTGKALIVEAEEPKKAASQEPREEDAAAEDTQVSAEQGEEPAVA
jgi:large subunit ribosomal protein L9